MWDCEHCGCLAIAASLAGCPVCRKERDVPKISTAEGASNAWEPERVPLAPDEHAGQEAEQEAERQEAERRVIADRLAEAERERDAKPAPAPVKPATATPVAKPGA